MGPRRQRAHPSADRWIGGPVRSVLPEIPSAAYARLDFGADFDGGASLAGNVGVRYVRTNVSNNSLVAFPDPARFDATSNGGNGDGVVQVAEINRVCLAAGAGVPQQAFCQLT